MIIKKNMLKKEFTDKIEKAFIALLQSKDFKEISVTDICNVTGLHKSIFYANYLDINELADKVRYNIATQFNEFFCRLDSSDTENSTIAILTSITENQMLYKTYFKLGYNIGHHISMHDMSSVMNSDRRNEYHMEYFRSGFNAIVKKWLLDGCKETPKEIYEIFMEEYKGI